MGILVTGGAGYIGSVTTELLANAGHDVVVFDNLSKGHRDAVDSRCVLVEGDLANEGLLRETLQEHSVDAVVHFAADSIVPESVTNPEKYFANNVTNGLSLLRAMNSAGVKKMIFSSTAAVYGVSEKNPICEDTPTKPTNPYGHTKLFFEEILSAYDKAYGLKYVSLRYFNASGASENFGEDHSPETHLIPIILQAALGKRECVEVYGTDYPTRDGSCVRDYIHIVDLAHAHILGLESLNEGGLSAVYNLGNGDGYSVMEVIDVAEKVSGREIPTKMGERRPGDPPTLIASSEKISTELGWKPAYASLEAIIESAYNWQIEHPDGYKN